MKKMFAALLTTALLALGLVAFTGGTASAACPYTACVATTTDAKAPSTVKANKKVKVKLKTTASGNVSPSGVVTVTIKKKGGGFSLTKTKSYAGGTLKLTTPKLGKKGKYTVKATFTPAANSIFNPSTDKSTFKVK